MNTSEEALGSINTSRLEGVVLEEIKTFGPDGCISDEVRDRLPALAYSSMTARFSSLLKKATIIDTGLRRPGKSGRNQRVMRAVIF